MNSPFLYHRVPKNIRGATLYPLNELKHIYLEAYETEVKKYAGREKVLKIKIPVLNCLWNDALHFTAVPPQELMNALRSAGMKDGEMVWNKWFKVPANLLDPSKTIVCLYRRDISPIPDARDFTPFDPAKILEYRNIPPKTIAYYKEKFSAGERPLMFHRVPHVLYKGTIDTTRLEVIEING